MAEDRARLVELEVAGGTVILAEVRGSTGGDVAAGGGRFSLEDARTAIGEVGRWAVTAVTDALPEWPDRLEVEFGLKLAVKSGKLFGVLAEASGESSLLVRMAWEKKAETDGSGTG